MDEQPARETPTTAVSTPVGLHGVVCGSGVLLSAADVAPNDLAELFTEGVVQQEVGGGDKDHYYVKHLQTPVERKK